MYNNKKVYVIIGAAGAGTRMGYQTPKQFLKVGGKTILETAALKFNKVEYVDEIIVVTNSDYIKKTMELLSKPSYNKVTKVIPGGRERQDSIFCGVKALGEIQYNDIVLIHDGARPFVEKNVIESVIEAAALGTSVVPCVKVKDTVRQIESLGKEKSKTLNRELLYNVQTPQGFTYRIILEAYEKAFEEGFYGTDDSSLVERLGHEIVIVPGDYENIKITTKEDLPMETRIGIGYDVHKMVEGRRLILGGEEIPFEKGLLGHSDADVLVHALIDAILGAAGLGDIGKHFPDNDQRFKGASSIALLKTVKSLIYDNGYDLVNADITIIAQRPKIAHYIPAMKRNIAETLDVEESRINIKGTTTEKLGFVGREEGMAAEAVCLLNRR